MFLFPVRKEYPCGDFCLFCSLPYPQVLEEYMANTLCWEILFPMIAGHWNTSYIARTEILPRNFPTFVLLPVLSGILIQRNFHLSPPCPLFPEVQMQDDSLLWTVPFHFLFSHTPSKFKMQQVVALWYFSVTDSTFWQTIGKIYFPADKQRLLEWRNFYTYK